MEALAGEMEAIEAEREACDEDADEPAEVYAGLEEKAERIRGKLIRLPNRLSIFSR